ncbi:MAG: hypothetical protein KGP28_07055 [Bdellovibrionales bacterium]|nr:hypothetical protein [Bdellovibrionales bacterium]
MIQKPHLSLIFFFVTAASFAAGEDEEIQKDLEFFKTLQLIKKVPDLEHPDPERESRTKSDTKESEVKHETQ